LQVHLTLVDFTGSCLHPSSLYPRVCNDPVFKLPRPLAGMVHCEGEGEESMHECQGKVIVGLVESVIFLQRCEVSPPTGFRIPLKHQACAVCALLYQVRLAVCQQKCMYETMSVSSMACQGHCGTSCATSHLEDGGKKCIGLPIAVDPVV
jgi:hypothetical protein